MCIDARIFISHGTLSSSDSSVILFVGINFAASCRCHQRKASQRAQKSWSENHSIIAEGRKMN